MDDSDLVDLCTFASKFLSSPVEVDGLLEGGHESDVVLAITQSSEFNHVGGKCVLHVSPNWRGESELSWVHAVAGFVVGSGICAVAPIVRESSTYFIWRDRLVAVYPYVNGRPLDRDDEERRKDAACVLGKIHSCLVNFSLPKLVSKRDALGLNSGLLSSDCEVPESLVAEKLDRTWQKILGNGLTTSVTHGDYYRANILVPIT